MTAARFDAAKARQAARISETGGVCDDSGIHFTMDENSQELGLGSSPHASFLQHTPKHHANGNTQLITPTSSSFKGMLGSASGAEQDSSNLFSFSNRGRFRPSAAAFSSGWSSSGSESHGRGNFLARGGGTALNEPRPNLGRRHTHFSSQKTTNLSMLENISSE